MPDLPRDVALSIVLPIKNEAAALETLLTGFVDVLKAWKAEATQSRGYATPFTVELLALDDNSDDGSFQILERFAASAKGLSWLTIRATQAAASAPGRAGSGATRRLGTLQSGGEIIAWIDADGTYLPADLMRLFASMQNNHSVDQIVGARSCDHGRFAGTKFLLKRSVAKLAGRLWQTAIPDLNSGLRLFRREAVLVWLDQLPAGFSCTSTATLAALNANQTVRFEPIAYQPRHRGTRSKFRPVADSVKLLKIIWDLWLQHRQSAFRVPRRG